MDFFQPLKWSICLTLCMSSFSICSEEPTLLIELEGEETLCLEPQAPFLDVLDYLREEGEDLEGQTFSFGIVRDGDRLKLKMLRRLQNERNYYVPVTEQEKKEIRYIITTLAQNSLTSLANSKSSLKRAGERIDHIHPLRFLSTVFSNEELKVGVHAIRDRGSWIWDEFIGGLTKSLKEESVRQNMSIEFIQDFATTLKIDPSLILPQIQGGRWKEFVNTLIDTIPRANNPNRYNM